MNFFIKWLNLPHLPYSFLQIAQISVILFLQSLPEQVLRFLSVGAHSTTATFSVCSLLFRMPPVSSSLALCMNILRLMLKLQMHLYIIQLFMNAMFIT